MARQRRPVTVPPPATEATARGYDPVQIYQLIKQDLFQEVIGLDPAQVPWFFVSNMIQRAISRIYAQGDDGPVAIAASDAGALHITTAGGEFRRYQVFSGNAADAPTTLTFGVQSKRLDLLIYDNPADVAFSPSLVYPIGDYIEIWANTQWGLDAAVRRITVRNHTAGAVARYCFVGWYLR